MRTLLLTLVLCSVALGQPAAKWDARADESLRLRVRHDGDVILTTTWVFWGANYKWATPKITVADGVIRGDVADLGLRLSGTAKPTGSALAVDLEITAARDLANIVGGGMELRLKTASRSFAKTGEVKLLPERGGFEWLTADGVLRLQSAEPLADCYFEKNDRGRVRVMLVGKSLAAGTHRVRFTLQLPDGGVITPPPAERYGRDAQWRAGVLPWDAAPVDLRFLNDADRPAGRRGFLQAKGEELIFEDGTPARFWGTNVAAYALFENKEAIGRQARRLAQLGFNLVRLHHHDTTSWVKPTVIDQRGDDSGRLDLAALDRLDWWVWALKQEGIYVWLDLHVGRQFKAGDGIEGFDELAKVKGDGKGFNYFNPRVEELMRQFNAAYLGHVNPYTKLAYKDDPAVAFVLITNENDVTHHFGNRMLPDKGNPWHNARFESLLADFTQRTGLPRDPAWRTWEPGPSKLFLNDVEHAFNARMLKHLRKMGVRVPAATTNFWGDESLYSLPALTDGDIVDAHAYGEAEMLETNPRYGPHYLAWAACAAAAGKPLAISEWNVAYPAIDRFTAPLNMMSIASLQGWDALMHYNYTQHPLAPPTRPHEYTSLYDPALTGLMPAAAIAFRQGHVSAARKTYWLDFGTDAVFNRRTNADNSAALRTLLEQSRVRIALPQTPALPWLRPAAVDPAAQVVHDPEQKFLAPGQYSVRSDTGELFRDFGRGIATIDTPRTQAASGWIGEQSIALSQVEVRSRTSQATICMTSLDGRPIADSRRLLITAVARVLATPENKMPLRSEVVEAILMLKSNQRGLKLLSLGGNGEPLGILNPSDVKGVYTITLPAAGGVHWYLLQ